MTEATDLASVEDGIEERRRVLAALKAQEAALVTTAAFDDRGAALAAEARLLDAQINEQLNVIAGHAGIPSTDIADAKQRMLAAVEQQVRDQKAADDAAAADVEAADEHKRQQEEEDARQVAEKAAADAQGRLDAALAASQQAVSTAPPVNLPPTPAQTVPTTPSVGDNSSGQPSDTSGGTGEPPTPPLPPVPTPTAPADATATDTGKDA